jgi:hypothetical protein
VDGDEKDWKEARREDETSESRDMRFWCPVRGLRKIYVGVSEERKGRGTTYA